MAFDELKQDLMEAEADVRSYMESSDEYLRLKIFKVLMRSVTSGVQFMLIGIGVVFALLFLSFAASLALSEALDSYYTGFMIVAGFYVVIGILLYVFREKLNAPILRNFSKHYFD
jgi:uncharacterized membrane protein